MRPVLSKVWCVCVVVVVVVVGVIRLDYLGLKVF